MRVLGLDPGSRHFGWGVVAREGTRLVHVAHGVIDADERLPLAERLVLIEEGLATVLERHGPACASVETLFFAKDAHAAATLGHARGVALLVCARSRVPTFEYAPTLVKRSVTGSGRAYKEQVAQMVRVVLGLAALPRADAADALAIALTHLQRLPLDEARARAEAKMAALLGARGATLTSASAASRSTGARGRHIRRPKAV